MLCFLFCSERFSLSTDLHTNLQSSIEEFIYYLSLSLEDHLRASGLLLLLLPGQNPDMSYRKNVYTYIGKLNRRHVF